MKHLGKVFVVVLMAMGLVGHAQDTNNPWAISFGVNAIDTRGSAGDNIFEDPFKVDENWNILPSISYLTIKRNIGGNFSVGLMGSVNKIERYVNEDPIGSGEFVTSNPGDLSYYAADVTLNYGFFSKSWF